LETSLDMMWVAALLDSILLYRYRFIDIIISIYCYRINMGKRQFSI
jgi:hypothetical protein